MSTDQSIQSQIFDLPKKPTILSVGCRLIFPLIMLILGASTAGSCPADQDIPVYLIVGGLMFMVSTAMMTILACTFGEEECPPYLKYIIYAVDLFNFIWFFVGSVWTYSAYKPNYDVPSAPNYCNSVLYIFSFTYFTIVYITTAIFIIAIIYKIIFPSTV